MVNETQKTRLQFYKNSGGNEPVRHWPRPDAGAMALAGGHAVMPSDGTGFMGNTYKSAKQPHCPRFGMFAQRQIGGLARLHQEDAKDTRRRTYPSEKTPKGVVIMSKHIGSSLDDFLKEEGIYEETQAMAIKEVVVWQLTEAMKKQSLTKTRLATMLKTSRSQVDRLLDPTRDVTLSTLQRAAALVGRKVQIELV
uniref:Uncharacterized protein n=1 Tax=mine drainage metagenome TaxID=410659 RepID=E6QW26_9ZZZZ